jgi:hypothetical protein
VRTLAESGARTVAWPEALDRVGAVSRAPALRITRRTTLGGALVGVAVLAGCDLGDGGSGDPASAPTPSAGTDDPDAELVEAVVDDVAAIGSLVKALRRRHASLRRPLGPLARVHDEHLEVLGSDQQARRTPPRTDSAAEALALLRTREVRHQRLLANRAVDAQSGRLARLLASMSAAVAQQVALLPEKEDR